MNFLKDKSTRAIILIMVALVLVALIIAKQYYGSVNKAIDPRIEKAREMYNAYNNYAQVYDDSTLFQLLDSIEIIYSSVPHYKNSYEIGVLYNNRAAIFLTQALAIDSLSLALYEQNSLNKKDSLLNLAVISVDSSISIYANWKNMYATQDGEAIKNQLRKDFFIGLENYSQEEKNAFFASRLKELITAQKEIDRRMSVSLTNLGIIKRHKENYEKAAKCYQEAIDLWERNLTAENNLRILLGQPIKKESFLRRLFPPDKDESKN